MKADAAEASGVKWATLTEADISDLQTYLLNVVEDTTPQLGGALDGQGNDLNNLGVIFLTEQAAAEADVLGKGQWWVKTATPNEPWFTDDAGTDFHLASLAGTETLTNKTINTASNTITVVEADITDLGTTVAMVADKLSVFAATTSAQLAGVISDETGTGLLVFATSPTFTTDITTPLVIGGTATTSDLTFKTTSGVGTTGADMHFLVGNNGATEAMTILNSGNVGIDTISPLFRLHVSKNADNSITTCSAFSDTATHQPFFYAFRSRGTEAAPAAVQNNDDLGRFNWAGQYSSAVGQFTSTAYIKAEAAGNFSVSSSPSRILFFTTSVSTSTPVERMRIDSAGNVGIGTSLMPTGTATKVLSFGDNGGDPTMGTDVAAIFAKDVGGTNVAMHFVDESDTVTQMAPHDSSGEWVFNSYNHRTKKKFYVKMEKLIKRLAEKFPDDFANLIDEEYATL